MQKEFLEQCLAEGMSLEAIGKRVGKHESTVSHWMKKYGLEAARACKRHGSTVFVREGSGYYRCKRCRLERVAQRRRTIKRKLVEEAGGRCVLCGYDRCQQVLEFHLLDPGLKEFQLSHNGATRSLEKSRAEARKCILLCANCHREVEAGIRSVPLNSVPDAIPG